MPAPLTLSAPPPKERLPETVRPTATAMRAIRWVRPMESVITHPRNRGTWASAKRVHQIEQLIGRDVPVFPVLRGSTQPPKDTGREALEQVLVAELVQRQRSASLVLHEREFPLPETHRAGQTE